MENLVIRRFQGGIILNHTAMVIGKSSTLKGKFLLTAQLSIKPILVSLQCALSSYSPMLCILPLSRQKTSMVDLDLEVPSSILFFMCVRL